MPSFNFEDLDSKINQDFSKVQDAQTLESLRIKYLGRKGILAELTSRLSDLPQEQRPEFGRKVNRIKQKISDLLEKKKKELSSVSLHQEIIEKQIREIDITLPGIMQELGHRHVITQIIEEICEVFLRLGFAIVEGPEIETEYNNFTALNIPLEHPSRDMFDTFYLSGAPFVEHPRSKKKAERLLLRSHTSPMQIRVMKSCKPPLAVVVPGRVYRPDAVDASHSFMFHQIEGFMVDYNITFSDLKGILEFFVKSVFGSKTKMRLRPHFFPFTEPSAEMDISCIICKGKGCGVCGKKGWLEILGCGMIHPKVFKYVGYDAQKYTGFAFGMGVDRIAMLKYGIDDIRLFYENDLRFLRQF